MKYPSPQSVNSFFDSFIIFTFSIEHLDTSSLISKDILIYERF